MKNKLKYLFLIFLLNTGLQNLESQFSFNTPSTPNINQGQLNIGPAVANANDMLANLNRTGANNASRQQFNRTETFKDGDIVTIKDQNNGYLAMPLDPTQGTKYNALFVQGLSHPNRLFKIKKFGNYICFLGTNNGFYSGQNFGMLNTSSDNSHEAFFDIGKSNNPTDNNKFILTHKEGQNYTIKNINNKYESPSGNFLKNDSGPNKDGSQEYIFEIKKILADGEFVTIKNNQGKYMEILTSPNQDGDQTQLGLSFNSTTLSKTSQKFKIAINGDYIGFTGSTNGNYSLQGNSGRLDAYFIGKNAYFFKKNNSWNVAGYRAFLLYPKGIDRFGIYSLQHQRFEKAEGNELIESDKSYQDANNLDQTEVFEIKLIKNQNNQAIETGNIPSTDSETIAKLQETISQMQTTINLNDQTIKRLQQEIEKLNAQLSSRYKGRGTSSYSRQTGYRSDTSRNIRKAQATSRNTGYRRSNTTRGRASAARGRASAGRGYRTVSGRRR